MEKCRKIPRHAEEQEEGRVHGASVHLRQHHAPSECARVVLPSEVFDQLPDGKGELNGYDEGEESDLGSVNGPHLEVHQPGHVPEIPYRNILCCGCAGYAACYR